MTGLGRALIGRIGVRGWLIAAACLLLLLGYRHYTGLLETVSVLESNSVRYEVALGVQGGTIDAQERVIGEWQESQDRLLGTIEEMGRTQQDASTEIRRLNDVFAGHDLEALARARPGLIERRINSGTAAAWRMLECASGAVRPDCPAGDNGP